MEEEEKSVTLFELISPFSVAAACKKRWELIDKQAMTNELDFCDTEEEEIEALRKALAYLKDYLKHPGILSLFASFYKPLDFDNPIFRNKVSEF